MLPATLSSLSVGYGVPIIAEDSFSLTSMLLSTTQSGVTNSLISEFSSSIANAPNLINISFDRCKNLGLISLSDVFSVTLEFVSTLAVYGTSDQRSWNQLTSLDGIEYFPNLETLDVYYTANALDVSSIKLCSSLKSVDLHDCYLTDITDLESLGTIQTLLLNDNSISKLQSLQSLINLTTLNLQNNAIYDTAEDDEGNSYNNLQILIDLYNNGSLRTLYISGNKITEDSTTNSYYKTLLSLDWTDSDF